MPAQPLTYDIVTLPAVGESVAVNVAVGFAPVNVAGVERESEYGGNVGDTTIGGTIEFWPIDPPAHPARRNTKMRESLFILFLPLEWSDLG